MFIVLHGLDGVDCKCEGCLQHWTTTSTVDECKQRQPMVDSGMPENGFGVQSGGQLSQCLSLKRMLTSRSCWHQCCSSTRRELLLFVSKAAYVRMIPESWHIPLQLCLPCQRQCRLMSMCRVISKWQPFFFLRLTRLLYLALFTDKLCKCNYALLKFFSDLLCDPSFRCYTTVRCMRVSKTIFCWSSITIDMHSLQSSISCNVQRAIHALLRVCCDCGQAPNNTTATLYRGLINDYIVLVSTLDSHWGCVILYSMQMPAIVPACSWQLQAWSELDTMTCIILVTYLALTSSALGVFKTHIVPIWIRVLISNCPHTTWI